MSGKLVPIGDGVWCVDHHHSMLGIQLGLRTVVVDHGDGALLIYSPGPCEASHWTDISSVGDVTAILAPNGFHHLYVRAASARFPDAKVLVSPGIRDRSIGLTYDEILGETKPSLLGDDVETAWIHGMPNVDEIVLLHKPSRSLVVCDLAMNVHTDHWFTSAFMRLNGRYRELGPTRFLKMQVKDASAFEASVERVLGWDFDRVVVCHGEVVHSGGKAQLVSAFAG